MVKLNLLTMTVHIIYYYGNIVLYKLKCLNDVRKELKTSVWKRKITMYKNKKKYL